MNAQLRPTGSEIPRLALVDARVAIVGCGRMGRRRAAACVELGSTVAVLHDSDPVAARALAGEHPGAAVAAGLSDVDWSNLDAALVCTPPASHVAGVVAAIRAGVPVFMEKPVGVRAADVERIAEELRARPVLTAVGYMNRYRPSVEALRAEFACSDVFGVNCGWVAPAYRRPWWADADGGGALNDYATHLVDLCRYLIGEITDVYAVGPDACGAVCLSFAGGACGTLFYSSLGSEKHISFELFWRDGHARLEGWNLRRADAPDDDGEDIFVRETRAFLLAVQNPTAPRPLSDFADARRTQLVVDAIRRALRTGHPQEISGSVA